MPCPDSTVRGADFNSTAYALDPIRVHKDGSFSITSAVIDTDGLINHFTVKGRIKGYKASGSLRSTRDEDTGNIDGQGVVACTHAGTWKAEGPAPVAPVKTPTKPPTTPTTGGGDPPTSSGPIASGPTAYFDVDGYRRGSQGAWTYYLIVTISGCADASTARVEVVGGAVKTAPCSGKVQLGPLTPKQTYQVRVTAIGSRRVTQPLASIYLPGDDGNWVRISGTG